MEFYMQLEGVNGDTTAKGHEKWITLNSVTFGVDKTVTMKNGVEVDRQIGSPRFQQVEVTKNIDSASPHLFAESCSGQVIPQIVIHECRGKDTLTPFVTYTLSNVLISHYFSHGQTGNNTQESLRLSFTKIEMKVDNKTPIVTGYNLETSQVL